MILTSSTLQRATAVSGTVGILHSTKNRAPSVKRVIITSSTASVLDPEKDLDYEYSEVSRYISAALLPLGISYQPLQ